MRIFPRSDGRDVELSPGACPVQIVGWFVPLEVVVQGTYVPIQTKTSSYKKIGKPLKEVGKSCPRRDNFQKCFGYRMADEIYLVPTLSDFLSWCISDTTCRVPTKTFGIRRFQIDFSHKRLADPILSPRWDYREQRSNLLSRC
jgi:hypothetical protein